MALVPAVARPLVLSDGTAPSFCAEGSGLRAHGPGLLHLVAATGDDASRRRRPHRAAVADGGPQGTAAGRGGVSPGPAGVYPPGPVVRGCGDAAGRRWVARH